MKTSIIGAAFMAALATASPVVQEKRQSSNIDGTIFQFALTLEHLEAAFYAQALKKFTKPEAFTKAGFPASTYNNLKVIASDEATHVVALQAALKAAGATPVEACEYSFPYTDVASFLTLAGVLEGVGTSAYLGAAASITDKGYLTNAASILAVEARHSSFIRGTKNQVPFPSPFDTPLRFRQVQTLAGAFIKSCPSTNQDLGIAGFPALSVASKGPYIKGGSITFNLPNGYTAGTDPIYVAWPTILGATIQNAEIVNGKVKSTIPADGLASPSGQSYAVLTTASTSAAFADSNTVAGPAVVQVRVKA